MTGRRRPYPVLHDKAPVPDSSYLVLGPLQNSHWLLARDQELSRPLDSDVTMCSEDSSLMAAIHDHRESVIRQQEQDKF